MMTVLGSFVMMKLASATILRAIVEAKSATQRTKSSSFHEVFGESRRSRARNIVHPIAAIQIPRSQNKGRVKDLPLLRYSVRGVQRFIAVCD